MSPPSGVVTFLFTDIEGSTRRWEADANEMRVALAAHDKVLRSAIAAQQGFVFSHSGDGMAAAFASPLSAVTAAIGAQRELQLPVRMGIATGEAELRDGDYFGTVLNRAARVMAAGHGGQILVTDSTAGLLSGIELINLGPRRLRDLPNPIGIYQLRSPGLATDFPPLRTIDTNVGNLRPPASSLVGRNAEVSDVASEVRSHRLVTLVGVGGVGKTRLALEVASALTDEFPDGVWVFELASVVDPAAVPEAVASVLGITQQPGMTMSESVAAALEGRHRLLVFDNCEHIVDAAADLVDTVLAQSHSVRILATSREGLGIADERLWRVPSLDETAAVELFIERAQNLSQDESTAVAEVCLHLDGIPLAIELAASRLESMTATEVRDHLDQRFKLLVRSRRGLARHQTLRHAVAWSYDLLEQPEKTLLERCSVFAGGFDARSARALSDFDDEFGVLGLLDTLVRKSLLVVDHSTGRTRFSMLETIRQFAEEQLVAHGSADDVSSQHASHFASRVLEMMEVWNTPRQRETYDWAVAEFANLRTAFRWAVDQGDLDVGVPIATWVGFLGVNIGNMEPLAWAEELVDPAHAIDHPGLLNLAIIASTCWMPGRAEAARGYFDLAISLLNSSSQLPPFGIESWLGSAYVNVGQPERAAELTDALLRRRGDDHVALRAARTLYLVFSDQLDAAVSAAEGVIETGIASNNPYLDTFASSAATMYPLSTIDPGSSLPACRRGLALARDSGNSFTESILAFNLARIAAHGAMTTEALEHLTVVIRNYHDSGNVESLRSPLGTLSSFLDRLGHFEAAATLAGYALSSLAVAVMPEFSTAMEHLREVLGDDRYESLAQNGEAMPIAEITAYAYEQIDRARIELERSA